MKFQIKKISLKWQIIFFFVFLGFIPMLIISYFAVFSYSVSINSLTDKYVSKLIQRIAEQTASRGESYFKYLEILSKTPFVQLSFHKYPNKGGVVITREKLELFRIKTGCFEDITLFANDGHIVTSTSDNPAGMAYRPNTEYSIALADQGQYQHQVEINTKISTIILYQHVYDFRHPDRLVGLAATKVNLDKFLSFTRQLNLGAGVQITIVDNKGLLVYSEPPPQEGYIDAKKEFLADVPILDWTIRVFIPERQLLKDVNQLTKQMVSFTILVALLALTASFIISRLAVKPLIRVINGTREFASGNLDHRIQGGFGLEAQQVAMAFNTMADEIKKRQAEMIQADKLASLGLLSAGFAHEVRNPLAGIKTCAQVIGRQSSTKEVTKLAKGISTEVDRLNKIVTDLLHFSKPKPSKKMPCDLYDLVNQSLKILKFETGKKKVTIVNRVERQKVVISPGQMIQILINLLLNALAAVAPEKGVITISTMVATDHTVVLSVQDNGYGIPQEKIPRIFDPFFSLSKQGNGLGLSVAYLLLTSNNIDIDVKSIEGEGTTFLLYFNTPPPSSQEV